MYSNYLGIILLVQDYHKILSDFILTQKEVSTLIIIVKCIHALCIVKYTCIVKCTCSLCTLGIILPGREVCVDYVFKSPNIGIYSEEWELVTTPILSGGRQIVVTLKGVAFQPDLYKEKRQEIEVLFVIVFCLNLLFIFMVTSYFYLSVYAFVLLSFLIFFYSSV